MVVNKKNTPRGCFFRIVSLLLLRLFLWKDVHERTRNNLAGEVFDLFSLEFYETTGQSKEGIILPTLDVFSRMELRPALSDDDVAGRNGLIAEDFDAKTLGDRITAKGG